jgi:hypothetical protein
MGEDVGFVLMLTGGLAAVLCIALLLWSYFTRR